MHTSTLIIGQGICGSMLSWFLYNEGQSFIVLDDGGKATSKVAAGIINPVTGRRYHTTWMAEELLPFCVSTYESMGKLLDEKLIEQRSVIDFFPNTDMREAFLARLTQDNPFLHPYPDQNYFNQFFHYYFGTGEIKPAYTVNLQALLDGWRRKLEEKGLLVRTHFIAEALEFENGGIQYDGIRADRIVFCDGPYGIKHPLFERLPFAPSKGEALVMECPELANGHIYKKGMMIAPLAEKGYFWVGASNLWEFEDEHPTAAFREKTMAHLDGWLKKPYKVVDHKSGIRPATLERRPFVGFHPAFPQVGILNGMGSKGTSLAPFFANQLVQHIVHRFPIAPEADLHRFARILSK